MNILKSSISIFVLLNMFLLSGCISLFEPKELTEEEKTAFRKKLKVTKTNVVDPLVGIIETSCRYYSKYNTWPKVKFKPSSSSHFNSFSIVPDSGDKFNVFFRLKASSISWNVEITESSPNENAADCDYQITGDTDRKSGTLKQTGQYKIGETFSTEQERMFLASRYFFFTEIAKISQQRHEISKSEKLTKSIGNAFLQVAICVVLGIEPEYCN